MEESVERCGYFVYVNNTFFRSSSLPLSLRFFLVFFFICLVSFIFNITSGFNNASAATSTISLSVTSTTLSLDLTPNLSSGVFGKTGNSTASVTTNNIGGYTLSLKANTSGTNATNLVNGSSTLSSISSAISESTFSAASGTSYNNKWGVLPSRYNSSANTSYRPAPSTSGYTLDTTSAANSTANTYTIAFGARVDQTAAAGTYTNTFVLTAVTNPVSYSITYNANAGSSTVTNMPSPNPLTGTTSSTSVSLSSTVPTRSGYTFGGWCSTTSSNGTCSGTTYNPNGDGTNLSYPIDQTAANTKTVYAIWVPKTYTATIYYNNKTSSGTVGTTSITNTPASGTGAVQCTVANDAGTCSPTIPTAVTNSVGTYNNAYVGLASSTGTMSSATSITLSGNATFYAVYRTSVDVVSPTSTSAASKTTVYRNQWFTSTTAMSSTVLATTTTGKTTDYSQTGTVATNYSFAGYASAVSSNIISSACYSSGTTATNCTSVSYLTQSALAGVWAVYGKDVTVTFYYNNNTNTTSCTTANITSKSDADTTGTQYLRPTSNTAAGIAESTISVPQVVQNSKGTCGMPYINVGTSTSTMVAVTPTTANTTYYTRYSQSVTNYYYNGSSATTRTIYRNQRVNGTATSSVSSMVLAISSTGTSDYSTETGPGGSSWEGLQNYLGTYYSVADTANSNIVYTFNETIYRFNVTFSKGTYTSSIGSTSGFCRFAYSYSSCSVATPTITPNTGYVSNGWSTTKDDSNAGTAAGSNITLSSNNQTYYGNSKIGTYNLTINFAGQGVSSVMVCSAPGAICMQNTSARIGIVSTSGGSVGPLIYGSTYYLIVGTDTGYSYSIAKTAGEGSYSSTNNSFTVGPGDGTITVTGTPNTYSLTVNFAGQGVNSVRICKVANPTVCQLGADQYLVGDITTSGGSTSGMVYGITYYLFPSIDTGYSLSYAKTAGEGTMDGNAFTIGAGNGTATVTGTPNKYTCTKQYRLQNADGTYPSSYTADGTSSLDFGTSCSYSKSATNFTTQSGSCTITTSGCTISLSLPRTTLYMHEWNACSALTANSGYVSLTDKRDNEVYKVGKVTGLGNKCIMLENLRLGSTSAISLTSTYSNVSSSYSLPAHKASCTNTFTTGCIKTTYKNSTTNTGAKRGVYYNYCAATAGTYCYASGSGTSNSTYNVCPKNWTFMTEAQGESMGYFRSNTSVPAAYAGYWNQANAEWVQVNSTGIWWTRTYDDGTGTAMVTYAESASTHSLPSGNRAHGRTIRCIQK